jgi:uncharacterized protein YbjT (DUF2867 family)
MAKPIIAVVGATGAQGGGLVRAIQADPEGRFVARALTRDPGAEKARALARLGAEVVQADVDDEASLVRGFDGAAGAFCVTFFWAHMSPEREIAEAGAMARAAKRAKVGHVVWSTLEDTRRWVPLEDRRMPTLQGRWKVPHFDAKGEANRLFEEAGVPTTFLNTSFYWDNLVHFGMGPRKGADGRLVLTLPLGERRLPGIAAEDIGKCALGIFKRGRELVGKTVSIAGEHPTGAEMARALSDALGREVVYAPLSFDAYRNLGFPGADDLGNMFHVQHDFNDEFCGKRDVAFSRALDPELKTFRGWLAENAARIPIDG